MNIPDDACESRVSDLSDTRIITFSDRAGRPQMREVTVAIVDGDAYFEGDILVDDSEGLLTEGIGISSRSHRWPGGVIPYVIDPALENQERVSDAIAHWEANTPIRLVPRTDQPDYVMFRPGGGCSSAVGRRSGLQYITLGPYCTTGNTIHEIGHAVGLWHEQSREDRNSYVTVKLENVRPNALHNFSQHIQDGDDLGGYDYGSIMHYPRTAFSKNGEDTIVPKGGQPIGQRSGLSQGDIAAVKEMYDAG